MPSSCPAPLVLGLCLLIAAPAAAAPEQGNNRGYINGKGGVARSAPGTPTTPGTQAEAPQPAPAERKPAPPVPPSPDQRR